MGFRVLGCLGPEGPVYNNHILAEPVAHDLFWSMLRVGVGFQC